MAGALENIKVLDITHVLAGPFCTYQLALLGADVTKIEAPDSPDCARGRGPDDASNAQGLGLNYQVQGGNKRSLALDLSQDEARNILLALVKDTDVLVENYTTGTLERLGVSRDVLMEVNPKLVHCSLTGFGDTGPAKAVGAYDNVIQAKSGTISQCGGQKPGVSFIDYASGYAAAFAVSSALVQRNETGRGCHISVSMLEVAMQMMAPEVAAAQFAETQPNAQHRPKEAGICAYDTLEGRLMLGAFRPHQYRKLHDLLLDLGYALPELADIHDWPDVWGLSDATRTDLERLFLTRSADDWVNILHKGDLPAERIQTLSEAVKSEQFSVRDYFVPNPDNPKFTLPLTGFRMSEGGPSLHSAPPRLGADSVQILQGLGYDAVAIEALRGQGVIA